MKVKVHRVCKDCGAKVERGRKGDRFPYGCPNCGNKTKDRTRKVRWDKTDTTPHRICRCCGSTVTQESDTAFDCPKCGATEKEQTKSVDHHTAMRENFKQASARHYSITAEHVPSSEPVQFCSLEDAQKIFDEWWRSGILKAELKPTKVLKVLYVMIEENREELRLKVVALCKLAGGEKRRMVARRYQRRGAAGPGNLIVTTTKKPDGDELFDDTPIGRDGFARRLLADLEVREADAARWLLEHADDIKRLKR